MRTHHPATAAEHQIEPHRFKRATLAARAAAWDSLDLDDLEQLELPQHSISSFFTHSRRRDARIFSR